MIVKMQLSTGTTADKQQVLVYDETRKHTFESEATDAVREMMKGRLKVYFAARMNGTQIEILGEVEDQDW